MEAINFKKDFFLIFCLDHLLSMQTMDYKIAHKYQLGIRSSGLHQYRGKNLHRNLKSNKPLM